MNPTLVRSALFFFYCRSSSNYNILRKPENQTGVVTTRSTILFIYICIYIFVFAWARVQFFLNVTQVGSTLCFLYIGSISDFYIGSRNLIFYVSEPGRAVCNFLLHVGFLLESFIGSSNHILPLLFICLFICCRLEFLLKSCHVIRHPDFESTWTGVG